MFKDNLKKKEIKSSEPVKIDLKDGLKLSYDKEDLKKNYPHLIDELRDKDSSFNIDSIIYNAEITDNLNCLEKNEQQIPNELINPGVNDFIRRCTTEKEAIEILDYLLKRKEISQQQYNEYKTKITRVNGLKELIEKFGGFKKPGYYEKKYYKKMISNNNR